MDRMRRYRWSSLDLRGGLEQSIEEHAAILRRHSRRRQPRQPFACWPRIFRFPREFWKKREPSSSHPVRRSLLASHPTFGVNLNNREPLIAPDYSLTDLLDLSEVVEREGFDSVWVGDSLFSKPRFEPISTLAAISQRTKKVKLGTACMVSGTRDPLYLALEWTTLDHLSNGRTILGTGMGNPEEGVRREYAAVRLDFDKRARIFEDGMDALRQLWTTGKVNLDTEFFKYDDISFYSGTEMGPLMPVQTPPPIWVVSNPRLTVGTKAGGQTEKVISKAARRIAKYGDGWMTCCRARHPEEFAAQLAQVDDAIAETGREPIGIRDVLSGDNEHRRHPGGGPRRDQLLYQPVLPGAEQGHGPPRMGTHRHARGCDRMDQDVQ